MGDEQPRITSDFPPPPAYFRLLASDPTFLNPPLMPPDGAYIAFGEPRKLKEESPSLESEGLKTLFNPNNDRKRELKKLVNLSKEKFTSVITALTKDATQEDLDSKLAELDLCFVNVMFLLNEMRGDEAKVILRNLMEQQITAKRLEVERLSTLCKETRQKVTESFQNATEGFATQNPTMDVVEELPQPRMETADLIDTIVKKYRGI